MTAHRHENLDAALFDAANRWGDAYAAYHAACDADAAEGVTGPACALVEQIETEIHDAEAATMPGVAVKLRIVEAYLDDEEDDGAEDRARAMSFSLTLDLVRMSRAKARALAA